MAQKVKEKITRDCLRAMKIGDTVAKTATTWIARKTPPMQCRRWRTAGLPASQTD